MAGQVWQFTSEVIELEPSTTVIDMADQREATVSTLAAWQSVMASVSRMKELSEGGTGVAATTASRAATLGVSAVALLVEHCAKLSGIAIDRPTAHLIAAAFLAAALAIAATGIALSLISACRRPRTMAAAAAEASRAAQLPPRGAADDVLVCRLCDVALPGHDEAARQKHESGKKHRAAATASVGSSEVFAWESAASLAARHGKGGDAATAPSTASEGSDAMWSAVAQLSGKAVDAVPQRAVRTGVELSGGVAVVHGYQVDAGGGGSWERVPASKGAAARASTSARGGGSGASKAPLGGAAKHDTHDGAAGGSAPVQQSFLVMEGGRNILEGLLVAEKFVSGDAISTWVDLAVREGQRGALRRDTWQPSRGGVAASLNYGALFSLETGGITPGALVEPLPPLLVDICRRVSERGDALGAVRGVRIDCATVYVLEPGMHIPPHAASSTDFARPLFLFAPTGAPTITFGMRIEEASAGQFLGTFDLQLKRRSLASLRGAAGSIAMRAVSAPSSRCVLIELRSLSPTLRSEAMARGNVALK